MNYVFVQELQRNIPANRFQDFINDHKEHETRAYGQPAWPRFFYDRWMYKQFNWNAAIRTEEIFRNVPTEKLKCCSETDDAIEHCLLREPVMSNFL